MHSISWCNQICRKNNNSDDHHLKKLDLRIVDTYVNSVNTDRLNNETIAYVFPLNKSKRISFIGIVTIIVVCFHQKYDSISWV